MQSAGIYPREIDQSFGIAGPSGSIGGIVIGSNKGPTELTTVTSVRQFIDLYGEPSTDNPSKHSAIQFLRRANRLHILRVINDAELATVDVMDDASTPEATFTANAKNEGAWGNNISLTFSEVSRDSDLFRVNIFYNGTQVENFDVSKLVDKKNGFGQSFYIEDVINQQSLYITIDDDTSNTSKPDLTQELDLSGGADDTTPITDTEITDGWDVFSNPNEISVNILINGGYASTSVQTKLVTIAETRGDAVAVLDVPETDSLTPADAVEYRNTTLNANTSYAALYSGWPTIYDQYNDRELNVPPSGFVAGVYAAVPELWSAPAGARRGALNASGVNVTYSRGDLDTLYEAGVNPIQDFVNQGVLVWGQKTLQTEQSALDRVNVRRLISHIKTSLSESLTPFVFEPNDAFTRENIASLIGNFLEDIQSRRGLTGFEVIVDETNNTPTVIDRNELIIGVYLQPTRVAEFIQLNLTITPSGVELG